jgi:PKHD-type hydroxylase
LGVQESADLGPKKSNVWVYEERLPSELCDRIVKEFSSKELHQAAVGTENIINTNVRNVKTVDVPRSHWVNGIPMYYGFDANEDNFLYNVSNVAFTEFFEYNQGMFYKPHIDVNPHLGHPAHNRKLTVITQLSDGDQYEGGDLQIFTSSLEPVTVTRKKGSIIVFNSSLIHQVTEITSGSRNVLASWIIGPPFS